MCLLLALLLPPLAAAEAGGKAAYAGGTISALPAGEDGRLYTIDPEYLTFVFRKTVFKILYERINLIEYGQKVNRRYALAILISPILVMSKKRTHYLTVGFLDDEGKQQAAVFQVDKSHIRQTLAGLEARTGRKVEFQDEEARKAGRG